MIEELLEITDRATASAERFRHLPPDHLTYRENPEKWNVLECIEHLNRYGDFYLPEIEKALGSASPAGGNHMFKSGPIGNYFANLMKVKHGRIIKMKTPADKNPVGSNVTPEALDRFLRQQETLRALLLKARQADLVKARVPISLAKFIKLRLGDILRVVVYHIERHIIQAENVVKQIS